MPITLQPIEAGETKVVGEKEYDLSETGELVMQVTIPVRKSYNLGGLLAKRAELQAELAEVQSLIDKHAELSA